MKCALCGNTATYCYYGIFVCRPHLRPIMRMGYEEIKLLSAISSIGKGVKWFVQDDLGGSGQKNRRKIGD